MNAPAAPTLGRVLRVALRGGKLKLPRAHWKILNVLAACRTPELGGHRYRCARCGKEHFVAHTCGNRHCPQCQGARALDWLEGQESGWVKTPGHYLFPVRALSKVFGGKFRAALHRLRAQGQLEFHGQIQGLARPGVWPALLAKLKRQKFVVYAKRPFAGPEAVLKYLSRYTHRVAIGNRRLLALDEGAVTFGYKDYADASRRKTMRLSVEEFVRRFCLHLLPERFVKIRHYGLLGNRNRRQRLERARTALGLAAAPVAPEQPVPNPPARAPAEPAPRPRCPHCGADALVLVEQLARRVRWIKPAFICDSS